MSKKNKKKPSNIAKAVRIIILITALAVFCFAAYKLYIILHDYKAAENEYADLQESYTQSYSGQPKEQTEEEKAVDPYFAEEEVPLIEDAEPPLTVDFDELRAINEDIVGWLYVDALPNISYPILKGEDNDFYLHHTFRKEYLFSGSIFMEYTNSADFSDPNTIVYGHNMKNQSMFGLLKYLREQERYDENPYFWIMTPNGNYRYHIFAAFETPYNSDTYTTFSGNGEAFLEWEDSMKAQSLVSNDVPLSRGDKTILLSTCTSNESVRFVVLGKCVSSDRPPVRLDKVSVGNADPVSQ